MDESLVRELRQMFLDGATPSRLMRHISDRHREDPRLHFVIGDYFREAFGIPLLRHVVPDEDFSSNPQKAHFNRDVVPEIIRRLGEWNETDTEATWLEGLRVASVAEHAERLKSARFEELDQFWDVMNDVERGRIIRKIAQANHLWDVVKVLAALAERLQQKLTALEARQLETQPARESSPIE